MDTHSDETNATTDEAGAGYSSQTELLERMGALAERVTDALLAPHRLTPPQARVLQAVYRHGPDVSLADIASATAFPPGAVTSILDRLVLRRLVERRDTGGAGQWMTCTITRSGREVIGALAEERVRLYGRLLDGFSAAELAGIDRLAALLEGEVAAVFAREVPPEETPEPHPAPVLRLVRGDRD